MECEDQSDCRSEDALDLGCYRPRTWSLNQDFRMPSYLPLNTSLFDDAFMKDENPQLESNQDSAGPSISHGDGVRAYTVVSNDVGLAPAWMTRHRVANYVSRKPQEVHDLMSSTYKRIKEEPCHPHNDLVSSIMEKLKRHQRDSNPDDYKNPYIQAPEENGVESVHMSSPPSVASTDHVVVKSSPTTVQTVLKMPSRSLHTGSDLPSPYQVLSTLPQVRLDPAIAKVHRAKWSAAEEQAILALVCKHTLPGSKTVHNWDKLMAEYNANGGRREAKALQMKVHRTDPRIKRGGSNNRGKAIKAKKAAMLTKANGGSV